MIRMLLASTLAALFVVWLTVAPGTAAKTPAEATHQEQLARAQELLDGGDAAGAIELLDRLARQKPPAAEVFLLRSTANFMSGDVDRGRQDLDRALEIDPDLRQAWLNRAALDLSENQYDAALQALTRAKEIDPAAPDNDLNIGAVELLLGDLQSASQLFVAYLDRDPMSADAYYLVATNYAMAGYAAPAIEHLRRAIELDEKSRLRARTDPNFGELASNQRFQQLLITDIYRIPPGAYQRTVELATPYEGSESVLLRAVLDALQASNQPIDRRVEVTDDWALIWGEMRIKLTNSASGKGQIVLSAPANQFTPAEWRESTDSLLREISVSLTSREH